MAEQGTKWRLELGCHRGTIISRDSTSEDCETLEECRRRANEARRTWAGFGYQVWFATAVGPDGERITLLPSEPYQS